MRNIVLFPGRHHFLTRFQAAWLRSLLAGERTSIHGGSLDIAADATVVFAVTSATHHGTRRNPIPFPQRVAAIERFAVIEGLDVVVAGVPDVAPTDRFAQITLKHVAEDSRGRFDCTPQNTVVACSTPELIEMYAQLGFDVAGVELDETPTPARPGELLEWCGREDGTWLEFAHPATVDVVDRYALGGLIAELYQDPVASDDGSLTETRDYRTYTAAFDSGSDRKWEQVAPWVRPGRVVDIGCAAGGLLERASRDPRLVDSDLYGVDISRHLLAEANHRKAQGVFANPNTFFVARNVLNGPAFSDRTVDTTLTVALTHEVHSYTPGDVAARDAALRTFISRVYDHTRPGGVWVCSDVCGPDDRDRDVILVLDDTDGIPTIDTNPIDTGTVSGAELQRLLAQRTTAGRFVQFADDFARYAGVQLGGILQTGDEYSGRLAWRLPLWAAMEFMTRKDYVDNWVSECHETFCHWSWGRWQAELAAAGFEVDGPGSWRNDWLVEHRFDTCAELRDPDTGARIDWPATHVLFAARRTQL